jgi:hypothetical protein
VVVGVWVFSVAMFLAGEVVLELPLVQFGRAAWQKIIT